MGHIFCKECTEAMTYSLECMCSNVIIDEVSEYGWELIDDHWYCEDCIPKEEIDTTSVKEEIKNAVLKGYVSGLRDMNLITATEVAYKEANRIIKLWEHLK